MKARYRPYNPKEGYFTFIDPEEIKKNNPLLKAIDAFVEEYISVEPFSQSARNEFEGAPAVHPRMVLKVIFYSYAKGIYSSREMEDRMRWDPNYIYLSSYHSSQPSPGEAISLPNANRSPEALF